MNRRDLLKTTAVAPFFPLIQWKKPFNPLEHLATVKRNGRINGSAWYAGEVANLDEIFALDPDWWYGDNSSLYRHTLCIVPENEPVNYCGYIEGIFWGECIMRNVRYRGLHKLNDLIVIWPDINSHARPNKQGVLRRGTILSYWRDQCIERLRKKYA